MQSSGVVFGLPKFKVEGMPKVCEACQFGKQSRKPFIRDGYVSKRALELIHSDVWGPTQSASIGRAHYYVSFIDDYSRKIWVYFMREKSEVLEHFKNFKAMVEREKGQQIKCLRSDGGGEYFSNDFSNYLLHFGIRRQQTCRYTPQQNGVAERKNRHIAEVARAMINEKSLPHYYWAEAVATAVYIMNRTPTASVHGVTPEEKFTSRKPDISHLKVFGCIAYVHIPAEVRSKLDPKAEKCIFIGYAQEQKGYRCYNPTTRKLSVSRDVVFDEMSTWYVKDKNVHVSVDDSKHEKAENIAQTTQLSGPHEASSSGSNASPWKGRLRSNVQQGRSPQSSEISVINELNSDSEGSLDDELGIPSVKTPGIRRQSEEQPRRSERVKYPVQRLTYDGFTALHYAYMVKVVQEREPDSFEEAVQDEKWQKAMSEEMEALDDNKTWVLVSLPEGKNAIGCKWVFKIKHNADGSVSRYKARLVAKGYAQTYGLDYEETFSPVAKMTTIRAVIAIAASKNWKLHQMDVKNAFLHGELEEEVYMIQPPGFQNSKFPDYVCKLKKALYGLKQSSRAWAEKIGEHLITIGFVVSKADFSLYIRKSERGILLLVIYVDDLVITGDHEDDIMEVKRLLKQKFEMKDLGELRYFLGIEVVKSNEGVLLLQRQYGLDMLAKYGMTACKPVVTPLEQNLKLNAIDGELLEDATAYRKMVGSLLYMTITRPDLSYAIGVMSQFMQTPRKTHLDAIRRIFRYVKSTIGCGLFYACGQNIELTGYTDADWAGNVLDRRSTSGYAFSFGSAVVSWSSKKQPTVALSSTEAEYRGAANATCEAVWLMSLLDDMGCTVKKPIDIWCDNISSIQLASNPVYHARTKHIEVHYHFLREKVLAKEINLCYVNTEDQMADVFTKAVNAQKLKKFQGMLGLRDLSSRGSVENASSPPTDITDITDTRMLHDKPPD